MKPQHRSHNARFAERLYARFLMLYPRRFRHDYGDALQQVFHDLLHDPTVPRWRVWLTVLMDIPGSVLPEHLADLQGGREMDTTRWIHGTSARYGALIGLVLGVIWTVYNVMNNAFNLDARGYALLNNGLTAALVLLFGVAGFAGGRHTGTIRAGTSAGVAAAVVSSVIGIATLWLATWLFFGQVQHNTAMLEDFHRSGAASMDAFIIEDALGASLFGPLLVLAIGTLVGTVGGVLAKATIALRLR